MCALWRTSVNHRLEVSRAATSSVDQGSRPRGERRRCRPHRAVLSPYTPLCRRVNQELHDVANAVAGVVELILGRKRMTWADLGYGEAAA